MILLIKIVLIKQEINTKKAFFCRYYVFKGSKLIFYLYTRVYYVRVTFRKVYFQISTKI